MEELALMSERCTSQQRHIQQLNKLHFERLRELLKIKGMHRSICRVIPGETTTDSLNTRSVTCKQESCILTASLTKVSILENGSSGRKQGLHLNRAVDYEFHRVYGVQESEETLHADLKDVFSAVVMGRNM